MAFLPSPSSLPAEVNTLACTFYEDVEYFGQEGCVLDLYVPTGGAASKPLVVYFHAGGFTAGDKDASYTVPAEAATLEDLIDADIIYASVNYRLVAEDDTETEGISKCVNDSIMAIQQLKFNATEIGIDTSKIAYLGKSAGSSICMYMCGKELGLSGGSSFTAETIRPVAVSCTRPAPMDLLTWEDYFSTFDFETMLSFEMTKDASYHFYGLVSPVTGDRDDFLTSEVVNKRKRLNNVQNVNPTGIALRLENFDADVEPTTLDEVIHHPRYTAEWDRIWGEYGESCDYYTSDPPAVSESTFLIAQLTT